MPGRVVMQGPATQLTKTDSIADLQLTRRIAELPRLSTIEVKLQKTIILRQAGEGVRPRHIARPQHQMLAGAVA